MVGVDVVGVGAGGDVGVGAAGSCLQQGLVVRGRTLVFGGRVLPACRRSSCSLRESLSIEGACWGGQASASGSVGIADLAVCIVGLVIGILSVRTTRGRLAWSLGSRVRG